MTDNSLILASGSGIRRQILQGAGVTFRVERPGADEDALKAQFESLADTDLALKLAEEKALEVSRRCDGLCLGADQILVMNGQRFDKAATMDEARARLKVMRGQPHSLICGTALTRGAETLWTHTVISKIWMRDYSDAFLDAYLDEAGEGILKSVACYQFEGLGAQLFDRIEGDYYAILGLPLLPVLTALRVHGALSQ